MNRLGIITSNNIVEVILTLFNIYKELSSSSIIKVKKPKAVLDLAVELMEEADIVIIYLIKEEGYVYVENMDNDWYYTKNGRVFKDDEGITWLDVTSLEDLI